MKMILSGKCPLCKTNLHINRLSCPQCRAEYPMDEELSPFDYLTAEQTEFLITFLKNKGNIKAVEAALGISYPTVNKRHSELLIALGIQDEKEMEQIDMSIFGNINRSSNLPSDIIKSKLYDNNGTAVIRLQKGEPCRISIADNGNAFTSDKLAKKNV